MNPQAEGFYFPPEWHPHAATWLSWPHNEETWPNGIAKVYPSYIAFIKLLTKAEIVHLNVNDASVESQVRATLVDHEVDISQVKFHLNPTNDAWIRDYGPSFLINTHRGQKMMVNWNYNAWGGKYPPYNLDNAIPKKLAIMNGLHMAHPGLVMEGGSVDFNGQGTLLTTTSCLLNPNRNPGFNKVTIENALQKYYGVRQVLWLEHGIAGDDTDGHIDDITRFVSEDTVITMVEEDPSEVNHQPLASNFAALQKMKLWDGRPLKVIPISLPKPLYYHSQRLPASYANFYICNAAVIVPVFGDAHDQMAIKTLQSLFPDRPVKGIDSQDLIGGLGSFHCLSQQEPKV